MAEAYIEGWWQTPDLRTVMALAVANEESWEQMLAAPAWLRWTARLLRGVSPRARRRARRNVLGRYDLGSDFYAGWLDAGMTFSAAMFASNDDSLEAAQLRKIHRICRLLRLAPGIRVLDMRCGWGSFAEVAARDYGCSVVGITLSRRQLDYAQARIQAAGLGHRVEIRLQDFRELPGTYDRIAAIEMIEGMDEEQWPQFFKFLHDRLGNSGVAALQVIAISDRLFENYRRGTDFIQRAIFPDGMLPSKTRLRHASAEAAMAWGEEQWFGRDYAETLARWQAGFQAAWPRIVSTTQIDGRRLDDRFKRVWEYRLPWPIARPGSVRDGPMSAKFLSLGTDWYSLIAQPIPPGRGVRVVGDVHGDARAFAMAAETDLFVVQLGDLTDYGPDSAGALGIALRLLAERRGLFLLGNHDLKLARAIAGRQVRIDAQLAATLERLDAGLRERAAAAIKDAPTWLGWGKILFVHAGFHTAMLEGPALPVPEGKLHGVLSRALYGQPTGRTQADGYPERSMQWVDRIPEGITVYCGHDVRSRDGRPYVRTNAAGGTAVFLDTGAGKGGHLSWIDLAG